MYSNHTHICTSIMNGRVAQYGVVITAQKTHDCKAFKLFQQIIKDTLANFPLSVQKDQMNMAQD